MKDLIHAIMRCGTTAQHWDAALDAFNAEFQISASCMFSIHEFRENRLNVHWSRFWREHNTEESIKLLQSGNDLGDLAGYQYIAQNHPQRLYDEYEMFQVPVGQAFPPSAVRDYTNSLGFEMRMATALNTRGPWIDGLFCQNRSETEWRRVKSDARTEIVLPLMGNSISLGRTLAALRSRFHVSLSVLDALGLGVFLADETGCVIEHNKEAQRIIDTADGLTLTQANRLRLHTPEKTSELSDMIDIANGVLRGQVQKPNTLMATQRPSGKYDWLISVRSLSDTDAELEKGFQCAFVTMIDPEREKSLSADGLAALGQLSSAERGVVDLLITGLRPADVATQRDVSLHTVKSQLKTISQKLRCSTQSDIIRMAAATRIPIEES